jgi:hypothetical protein
MGWVFMSAKVVGFNFSPAYCAVLKVLYSAVILDHYASLSECPDRLTLKTFIPEKSADALRTAVLPCAVGIEIDRLDLFFRQAIIALH